MIIGERNVFSHECYRDGPLLVIKWRYQVPLPVYMTENRRVTVVITPISGLTVVTILITCNFRPTLYPWCCGSKPTSNQPFLGLQDSGERTRIVSWFKTDLKSDGISTCNGLAGLGTMAQRSTPPKFNSSPLAPEKCWLGDDPFLLGFCNFRWNFGRVCFFWEL